MDQMSSRAWTRTRHDVVGMPVIIYKDDGSGDTKGIIAVTLLGRRASRSSASTCRVNSLEADRRDLV